ncbi:heme ABC transporter substrate-binding protein IsdE [Breznakia pachnodae]|uniref:High-affinity heme uptake system protein IsdE n=1 Tax=Breznakia pachnodae TaxID=265178 RepID=A0ABU0E5S1_9FIRM|nr:heme ABC transporter substrate-binding protein IsdE [Breznakia pachnodae]MDQ0362247.1 iron complex transport system substrate-binding protein [Breznakia pachnodae]
MKKLLIVAALLFTTGCVSQEEQSEERIVTTSVAIAEILDELGVDTVVGVPTSETYTLPERYDGVDEVGMPMNPDMEIISTLNPTLILSPNSLEGDLKERYSNSKIDAAFMNLKSVTGMYKSIEELGALIGKEEEAQVLVDDFKTYMEDYQEKNGDREGPRVLILMGLPGSYVVATENSYVGSLVELAGGKNVYTGESEEDFINVNVEDMLEKSPDIILRTSHAQPEDVQVMFEEEFSTNEIWQHFDAVTNNKVYDLDNEYFGMSANFNYQKALEVLDELFYGSK